MPEDILVGFGDVGVDVEKRDVEIEVLGTDADGIFAAGKEPRIYTTSVLEAPCFQDNKCLDTTPSIPLST